MFYQLIQRIIVVTLVVFVANLAYILNYMEAKPDLFNRQALDDANIIIGYSRVVMLENNPHPNRWRWRRVTVKTEHSIGMIRSYDIRPSHKNYAWFCSRKVGEKIKFSGNNDLQIERGLFQSPDSDDLTGGDYLVGLDGDPEGPQSGHSPPLGGDHVGPPQSEQPR